jgi:hypothetical protein
VARVDVRGDFDVARLGSLEGGFDIGLQDRLIAFDGEQAIRADVADGRGDFGIAGNRVDGDEGA